MIYHHCHTCEALDWRWYFKDLLEELYGYSISHIWYVGACIDSVIMEILHWQDLGFCNPPQYIGAFFNKFIKGTLMQIWKSPYMFVFI